MMDTMEGHEDFDSDMGDMVDDDPYSFFHEDNHFVLVNSILMGTIALVGLIGNLILFRAVIVYRKLRTDFNIVFCAIGIADSIFLAISVPTNVFAMLQEPGIIGDSFCQAIHYLINSLGFISSFLIVFLALLRGRILTLRGTFRRQQPILILIICSVVYVISLLGSIKLVNLYVEEAGSCLLLGDEKLSVTETWVINSLTSFIPLASVIVIYLLTYFWGKQFLADSYSPRDQRRSRMVTAIIIVFAVCQIPYQIFDIYNAYKRDETWSNNYEVTEESELWLNKLFIIKNYLFSLLMLNKALRPVLYAKLAPDLGESFDEVINCTYCHKNYDSMTPDYGNAYSIAGSSCGGAACAAGSFHATWDDNVSAGARTLENVNGACADTSSVGNINGPSGEETKACENVSFLIGSASSIASAAHSQKLSHAEAADELGEMDERPMRGYDRAISTSSSGSATSQIPLIKPDIEEDIEMF